MRKHSPRKWIHAILNLLPVILIPVFMVYSHCHNIDNYSVERVEIYEVNAFQHVVNGKPNNFDNWSYSSCDAIFQNYLNNDVIYVQTYEVLDFLVYSAVGNVDVNINDVLYLSYNVTFDDIGEYDDFYIELVDDNGVVLTGFYGFENGTYFNNATSSYSLVASSLRIVGMTYTDNYFYLNNLMLFNLTDIFGSGNEPSAEVFNSYLVNDFYDYGNNFINVGTHVVTYNDTDIGSQFIYMLYNSINKYFNFDNAFNFGGFYNWLNTNFFNGGAPLIATVIWNIIVYEFVVDLLFLFYSFFMFLIDFTESLLDKPFSKGR